MSFNHSSPPPPYPITWFLDLKHYKMSPYSSKLSSGMAFFFSVILFDTWLNSPLKFDFLWLLLGALPCLLAGSPGRTSLFPLQLLLLGPWHPWRTLQAYSLWCHTLSRRGGGTHVFPFGSSSNSLLINGKSMLSTSHSQSCKSSSHCLRNISIKCLQAPQTQRAPERVASLSCWIVPLLFFSVRTALSLSSPGTVGSSLRLLSPGSSTSYSSVSHCYMFYMF